MHRQQLCTDGDTVGPGYYSAAVSAAPGPRSPSRARGIPFAAPALWLADDAPSHIDIVVEWRESGKPFAHIFTHSLRNAPYPF